MLADLTRLLQSPEAAELKIMVVGHTDNQRLSGGPVRERFPNNFHLSTARRWPSPIYCDARGWASSASAWPVSGRISRWLPTPPTRIGRRIAASRFLSWRPTCRWWAGPIRFRACIETPPELG